MCGIVGYIGNRDCTEILLGGLEKLEYRGYDSAGLALVDVDNNIILKKALGKLVNLKEEFKGFKNECHLGIGHTRWATHGRPSVKNAHPHLDCQERFILVHNGIIENYEELKEELINNGHTFQSDTDTEVIVHLVEENFDGDLLEAVKKTINTIDGAYALGIMDIKDPEILIAARHGSPLVVGGNEDEKFIASDTPAILKYTRKIFYMDDREIAVLKRNSIYFYDYEGKKIEKMHRILNWDPLMAEKAGYDHFMLKEIYEQPRAVRETLFSKIKKEKFFFEDLKIDKERLKDLRKINIVACGTSYHASLIGKFIFEKVLRIPVDVDYASEFRYRDPILDKDSVVIVVSQSGETMDTLEALRIAKDKGAYTIAIVNVFGSTMSREADGVIYTIAGPEIGVASTKAFTSQLMTLYSLSVYLGEKLGICFESDNVVRTLKTLSPMIETVIDDVDIYKQIATNYHKATDFLYLGRGINYPVALEGALKLKEISYIHAEGYPAGEMKHGPIALVENEVPSVFVVNKSPLYKKVISNIQEISARDGIIISIATNGDNLIQKYSNKVIYIPEIEEFYSPLLTVIPTQLIAYFIAKKRGADIDKPRNLAKSVTVE
ncbi:MAG: glutamine--fructose-6-phosphate transaminase (isomerizing) [Candidatus Muiribacterium halophilum]|uniref:Glutamine--fructose-6-phosphate aminotransferase [isomerizing] n=1 Tax=Muiribacterium halophilum TaxID=2053465 RepID=A0A2N5ZM51_MUIH1|nr:MAG: glutamine--fructose-6-phosphate transaminase (isomerizing) [Candidatus Muirbacterium halophilum]